MDELVILHGSRTPRCTATVAKHFVGYHSLQCMAAGAIEIAYGGAVARLEGRWCWPCFPGPFIRFHRAPGCASWDHRYVAVTGALVARWVAEGLFPREPQPTPPGGIVEALFDELHAAKLRQDRWARRRCANLVERILIELADARGAGGAEPPWLARVLDALADPARAPGAAALARIAGMSPLMLRQRFRAATGLPLHAHVVRTRVAQARALLTDTDLGVAEIAARLGYRDVYFFTRQFRRHAGLPPARFRASARAR